MKLFCIGDRVVAIHTDDQDIAAEAYPGSAIVLVPDGTVLDRLGEPSETGSADDLPYARPVLSGAVLAATIKAACSRRINAVLKDRTTQLNMVGAAVALARKEAAETIGEGEADTLALLQAGQEWVGAMQQASRDLIADDGTGWEDDASWPAAPVGLADLADGF